MERMPRFRFLALTGAALMLAGSVVPARAQADPQDVQRGVARISAMDGDVTVRRGDSGDWVAGVINAPLMTGDQVATAANSRAEVQLDAANALRIGGDATVRIAQLQADRYQFEVARGTVTYRVLNPTDVNIEVDTQNLAVTPSSPGTYRIRVDDAGVSEITVREGSAQVSTAAGSQTVNAGQTLLARGPSGDPEFKITAAIPVDDWDHWNENRDQVELSSVSDQYVPPGVYGAEDLDQAGTWANDPDYGYVWQPYEPAGWSPYSLGQWTWEDWYGWTWVSYDPWGWAPYHYGRWFHSPQLGWAWYPGARFTRHYWSPGLVAFVGWGGAGFGLGYVGWVPLAPYELFHPWWGGSYYGRPGYLNRSIEISNVNIGTTYRNAAVANGINGVRGADFQGGRFQSIGHFTGTQIRDARVAQGAIPIAPGAANLRFSDRAVGATPRAATNTQFFARQQPRPAEQIPFAQQQRAFLSARVGGSVSVPSSRAATPAQAGARRGNGVQAQPAQSNGWSQYPDRTAQGAASQAERNAPARTDATPARSTDRPAQVQQQGSVWQRFGEPGPNGGGSGGDQRPNAAAPPAAQPGGWTRFGSPGPAPSAPRPPAAPAPAYRAPQYSPAPVPRPSAPQYSAPRPSSGGGGGARSAAPSHGGGGGHR